MAKRGRKSLSGGQQRAQGHKAVVAANAALEPPGDLDVEGKAEWNRIVAALTESARLYAVQWSCIHAAASAWGQRQRAFAIAAKEPPTYESDGLTKKNPIIDVVATYDTIHRARLEKLKLTAYALERTADVPVGEATKVAEEDERPGLRIAN